VDLDVPTEIVDALRQRLEHVDRGGAGLDEIEAYAANAEVVQPIEFGIGDAGIDHRHAARAWPQLGHRVERAGIIGSVGRGRDHDVAGRAEPLLKPAIVVDGRVAWTQLGVGSNRKAAVVNMHVAVARVRRRLEFWQFRSRRPGHGLGVSCGCVKSACHDRSHGFEEASAGYGAAHWSILPAVGRKPADRRDQTTSVAGGFKITDTGHPRRRHDPGNVRAQDRQELCFKPRVALEPRIVAPRGMGHGHETRMVA
jgi:hypothetical protein